MLVINHINIYVFDTKYKHILLLLLQTSFMQINQANINILIINTSWDRLNITASM